LLLFSTGGNNNSFRFLFALDFKAANGDLPTLSLLEASVATEPDNEEEQQQLTGATTTKRSNNFKEEQRQRRGATTTKRSNDKEEEQ
jgi:hypothetical protein